MGDETSTTDTTNTGDNETILTGATEEGTGKESTATDKTGADDKTTVDSDSGETGKESSDAIPDTYADFTMPENITIDENALNQALPIFKELELTQEQAQKIVSLQAELVQASSQKQIDDFNQLKNDWRTEASNDKEIGGDKFDENVKVGIRAVDAYGTPELKQLLDEQGLGNHPEVIRFMVRVGQTLKEDVPGTTGGNISTAKDRVTQMYGDQSK